MRIKYLIIILCLSGMCLSCNSSYDERIDALKQRREALRKADQETKDMLIGEMNRLAADIDELLAQMEERVLDRLDKMVAEVEDQILEQNVTINKSIKLQSDKLGEDIVAWRNSLDQMVTDNTAKMERARKTLQDGLQKATNEGNAYLISRIRAGLRSVDELSASLGGYIKKTQARVDDLKELEKVYSETHSAMAILSDRRQDMLASLDEYEERIQAIVDSKLEKNANKNLCDAVDHMISLYESASDIYNDSLGYMDEMDSFCSSMPDIEGLLDETESILDSCYDVESMLDDMDEGTVDDVLSYLTDALDRAKEGEVSLSDVEEAYEQVLKDSHDYLEDTNGIMDTFDEVIGILEDQIGDMESLISDVEDKF